MLALALHIMTQFFFIVIVIIVVKCDLIIDFFNNCYYPHIQQQQLLLIDEVNENCFGRGRPQQSASVTRHKIEVQYGPKRKRW